MSCDDPAPEPKPPFIIKCISDDCTVVHAGTKTYTAGELDDVIARDGNIPGSFGAKLREARDEVAKL
jgi:hypothetical protein